MTNQPTSAYATYNIKNHVCWYANFAIYDDDHLVIYNSTRCYA